MSSQPEAFSRVLIDQALRDSGWDLLDSRQVRFELHGHGGRADYVLSGPRGPLCVLEAKREDLDPYDAKDQARGYAENLRAPFVILSNGREHWFWNYERPDQRDAYRIERLASPRDLERLRFKNLQPPRPLMSEPVGPDYLKPLAMIGTIGNAAIVPHGREFSIKNVALFKPNPDRIATEYLHAFLADTAFLNRLTNQGQGVTQKFVGLVTLRAIRLPVPPLAVQRQFAARVAEIRALEARQAESRRRLDDLFQSLLHRAFCAEL